MAARKRSAPSPKTRPQSREKLTPRGGRKKAAVRKAPKHALPHIASELVDGFSYVRKLIREIPNFPQPGVLFKDITPLLANPKAFHIVLDAIAERTSTSGGNS